MLSIAMIVLLVPGADEAADKLEKLRVEEVKKLEGAWKVTKFEPERKIPDQFRVVFKADKVKFGDDPSLPFNLDVAKEPKWFDLDIAPLLGEKKKQEFCPGIYKLDGDKLILAIVNESQGDVFKPRPKDFKEKFHGQRMHLERVK